LSINNLRYANDANWQHLRGRLARFELRDTLFKFSDAPLERSDLPIARGQTRCGSRQQIIALVPRVEHSF
jgi:hypothetical protein